MNKKIVLPVAFSIFLCGCQQQKSAVREIVSQNVVEEEVVENNASLTEVKNAKKKISEKEKVVLWTRLKIVNNTENNISQILITENNKAPFSIYLKIDKKSSYEIDVERGKEFLIEVKDEKNHRYTKDNVIMFDTVNAEIVFTDKDFVSSGAKDLVTKFFGK